MGKKGLLVSFVLLFLTTTFSVQGGEMTKEVSYLNSRPSAVDKEALAQKVYTDFHSISDNGRNDIVHYTVPAISNLKRTEDFYPEDGIPGGPLSFIAAKDEFEPASMVLYAFKDYPSVKLTISDLEGPGGRIPSESIDCAVVKIWVQSGCAWYSYFSDSSGRELVPELLLHDEKLVRVDPVKRENYLRNTLPDGKEEYLWISAPNEFHVPVWGHEENIVDAKSIQPFSLEKGEFKQIWLTFHAPADAAAGIYRGKVSLQIADPENISNRDPLLEIPVQARILPFRLPEPGTNYDPAKTFYTSAYCNNNLARYVQANGGDIPKAMKRLAAEYKGYRDHNLMNPQICGILPEETRNGWNNIQAFFQGENLELYEQQMILFRDAGLDSKVLFDPLLATPDYKNFPSGNTPEDTAEVQRRLDSWIQTLHETLSVVRKVFPNNPEIYCFGWDEPDMTTLHRERQPWKMLHSEGFKIYSTGQDSHLLHAGFNEDFINYGGRFDAPTARLWHSFGVRLNSYANPHTGPENPDFCRRRHGMELYLADFDGTNNYMVAGNDWNDFSWAHLNFRAFNWVYPASDGFVTTIQFEGFREGIDDVKYATLLRQTAANAIRDGNQDQIYQAKAALQWLILADVKNCDLNTLRLEMIHKILQLEEFIPEKLSSPQAQK